jgi:hypothetical protein
MPAEERIGEETGWQRFKRYSVTIGEYAALGAGLGLASGFLIDRAGLAVVGGIAGGIGGYLIERSRERTAALAKEAEKRQQEITKLGI